MNGFIEQWLLYVGAVAGTVGTVVNFPVSFSSTDYCVSTGIGPNSSNNALFFKNMQKDSITVLTGNQYGTQCSLFISGY